MLDLFDIKNHHFVLIMQNKYSFFIIVLIFVGIASNAEEPKPIASRVENHKKVLIELVSTDEAKRFKSLNTLRILNIKDNLSVKNIETILSSLEQKNVSTLIFFLIEIESEILYHLSQAAKMTIENSNGSFPNISYYYARVNSQKGLPELYRLYAEKNDQRIYICKSIGLVGNLEASKFLMSEAKKNKKMGKNIFPMLAGIRIINKVVDKDQIQSFFEQNLNREELILLSKLKSDFTQKDLISLYKIEGNGHTFAINYIFRNPVANYQAIQAIVEKELEKKNYNKVKEWMMSDNFNQIDNNPHLKSYQEYVFDLVRNQEN